MRRKYYRTVESERKRRRQWPKLQRTRQTNILQMLDECMAALPILGTLTKAQREAIKTLQQMADDMPEFCSPFLDHDRERRHQNYLEKRRRHYWKDADFRQNERERRRKKPQTENRDNPCYDK